MHPEEVRAIHLNSQILLPHIVLLTSATETQINQPNLQQQLVQSSNTIKSFQYPPLLKGRKVISKTLISRSLELFHSSIFTTRVRWDIKMLLKAMHLTFSLEGTAGQGISKLRNPKHVTKELGQPCDKQIHQTLMNSPSSLSYFYETYLRL